MGIIMNRILIIGITTVILSTSAFASDKTGFYLKAIIGANKMNETTEKNSINGIPINSNKSKADISPAVTIGIGYYINDFIRHDLTFGYSKVNFANNTAYFNVYDRSEDLYNIGQVIANRKTSIYSFIFNSYIDLPITDNLKLFIGGGIGLAQIKEKLSQTWTRNAFEGTNYLGSDSSKNSDETKGKNNFAYSLTAGTSIKVYSNTTIELSYSWQDFGNTKYNGYSTTQNRYNGHSVMTGVRFDL